MDQNRPFTIITAVVRVALRSSGRSGVVVAGGGPEQTLLGEWLRKAGIPFVTPGEPALEQAQALLGSVRIGDPEMAAESSGLAGWGLAWAEKLLLLGTSNKTCLLLSPTKPVQSVLPLGDIFATQVAELAGAATLPPCLRGVPPEEIRAVDEALGAYYEGGFGEDTAFDGLDLHLRDAVLSALAEARRGWHPRPLIPKLGRATLGLDLDP